MKLLKILPIIVIALLAACWSFSYAETESDNDDLNLDSAFQAYAKEFESHNCRNRPENLKLKAAKDSLEGAIFPVLLTDKNISGCGFDQDVSSCKVLLKDDKIQLKVLSEEKKVKTTVNIANGIATVQEKFTSHHKPPVTPLTPTLMMWLLIKELSSTSAILKIRSVTPNAKSMPRTTAFL